MEVEIDGIPVDLGPSGVSQAADTSPPAGDTVVQPPATQDDPPADSNAAPPAAGDGKGDTVTPPNDGTDPAGVYTAETLAAREAAAEERGRQAALAQLQEAEKTQRQQTLTEQANDSYRVNIAAQRKLLEDSGNYTPAEIQAIMAPVDTHNRFVVKEAYSIGLELANREYANNLSAKLGDKATEFFNANGGKPEAVADIIDRFANFRGPDLPWFQDSKPEALMEAHKQLKAYVLTQIDEGVNAKVEEYKKANRPATQPVNDEQERVPGGPIGLAAYHQALESGGKLPSSKEIDALTAGYLVQAG